MSTVLVLSPHPDDEAIGCGGTLRRHVVRGDHVHVIYLTSGEQGDRGRRPEETRQIREAEARRASKILGVRTIEFWHEPDGALRAHSRLVRRLYDKLDELRPQLVYLPHDRDAHVDHRAASRVLRKAMPSRGGPRVMMFEVWTPLQRLDEIVDISRYVKVKLRAIRTYRSQCRLVDFDDAMLGLARYRGEMHSWPGGKYAEAFVEMRR